MRIDSFLVEKEYFKSRNKAQDAITQGAVYVNKKQITKSSFEVNEDDDIEILFETSKYVSRGGYKLEGAIEKFALDFNNKTVLDIGSSTGGFTDCSLQHGANRVYSVDVGSDQLDESLRKDSRVVVMENTNILNVEFIPVDYIVMDVSFVSIKHIIPALLRFITNDNKLICLIKPQFEVGKMINKGIIKDKKIHLQVLKDVNEYLAESGLYINQIMPSPIKGGSGNIEFISVITRTKKAEINFSRIVEETNKLY